MHACISLSLALSSTCLFVPVVVLVVVDSCVALVVVAVDILVVAFLTV